MVQQSSPHKLHTFYSSPVLTASVSPVCRSPSSSAALSQPCQCSGTSPQVPGGVRVSVRTQ